MQNRAKEVADALETIEESRMWRGSGASEWSYRNYQSRQATDCGILGISEEAQPFGLGHREGALFRSFDNQVKVFVEGDFFNEVRDSRGKSAESYLGAGEPILVSLVAKLGKVYHFQDVPQTPTVATTSLADQRARLLFALFRSRPKPTSRFCCSSQRRNVSDFKLAKKVIGFTDWNNGCDL